MTDPITLVQHAAEQGLPGLIALAAYLAYRLAKSALEAIQPERGRRRRRQDRFYIPIVVLTLYFWLAVVLLRMVPT
jgi:hypothetical protein